MNDLNELSCIEVIKSETQIDSIFDARCQDNSSLRILYLNAPSLKNKLDKIETLIAALKQSDVVISETWLDEELS